MHFLSTDSHLVLVTLCIFLHSFIPSTSCTLHVAIQWWDIPSIGKGMSYLPSSYRKVLQAFLSLLNRYTIPISDSFVELTGPPYNMDQCTPLSHVNYYHHHLLQLLKLSLDTKSPKHPPLLGATQWDQDLCWPDIYRIAS